MAARYNFSRFNILVADSNAYMRSLLGDLLRSYGVGRPILVDDAAKALIEMRTSAIDLVLVDWMLMPIDGCEFTKMVRTALDSPNPMVPIIMLSGHTEAYRVAGARDAGINEFLAKPVSAKTLFRRLVAIIERPRPFVRHKSYFGPDRRRHGDERYNGPRRRRDDKAAEAALTREEVHALISSDPGA